MEKFIFSLYLYYIQSFASKMFVFSGKKPDSLSTATLLGNQTKVAASVNGTLADFIAGLLASLKPSHLRLVFKQGFH